MPDLANPTSLTDSRKSLDTVTVEGQREIKRHIDAFVYDILVTYTNESLMRRDALFASLAQMRPDANTGTPNQQTRSGSEQSQLDVVTVEAQKQRKLIENAVGGVANGHNHHA